MNQVTSFLREQIRIVITVAAVIVLLIVWQFAWMSPKASEVASDHVTAATDQTKITELDLEIETLIQESEQVRHELPYLKRFPEEIPPEPQYGVLVHEIQNLEEQTDVVVNPLSVPQVQLSASGITTVPVNLQLAGGHDAILAFLAGLTGTGPHAIERLVTVQSFSFSGANPNVLASSDAPYAASISATAFTTAIAPPALSTVGGVG